GNGRADLQVPDVVEIGADLVAGFRTGDLQTALRQLHGQEEQGRETQQDEQSGADFESAIRLHDDPRVNATFYLLRNAAVRIRSRSSVSTDEATTVRVVASPTPAAVGSAW